MKRRLKKKHNIRHLSVFVENNKKQLEVGRFKNKQNGITVMALPDTGKLERDRLKIRCTKIFIITDRYVEVDRGAQKLIVLPINCN